MKKQIYRNNEVCIVGIGCVFPDADNPAEFWGNILKGHCSIKEMPGERFKKHLYFSADKKEKDKSYSNFAAFVDNERLKKICSALDLNFVENNRLQIMSLEATRQALTCLMSGSLEKTKGNASVFMGCMEIDDACVLEKTLLRNRELFKDYIEKGGLKDAKRVLKAIERHFSGGNVMRRPAKIASVLTTSVIDLIKKRFGLTGEGVLVDAACASSIAALNAAVNALKNHETNLAISGGIESNLGPDTFVLFSKVGAMSAGRCLPFDKRADGLSQGEGAAVFALQRVEDALKDGNKVYGIIRSVGGSSDGRSASLFSPSLPGQLLAYARAYNGLGKENVDYVECHGTGTNVGDSIEIRSLNEFFETGKIPVGSVKSLIGHTKGAAGAAGLLKCILAMENKIIPPSKYIESPLVPRGGVVYLNKKPVFIKRKNRPLRFGVSSFGFGNTNYHLILDEFKKSDGATDKTKDAKESAKVVVVGTGAAPSGEVDFALLALKFKIPPQSVSSIDIIHLLALAAVSDAFEKSNINSDSLDKRQVSVIAATTLGLDKACDFAERIRYFEFEDGLNFLDKKSLAYMMEIKNRLPEVTEDTGHGVLNNVIAGRICNVFDFKGKNFNVDSDFNSRLAALKIAARELKERPGIIILVYCDEKLNKTETRLERNNVKCLLLSTLDYAKKNNLPILRTVEKINYHD